MAEPVLRFRSRVLAPGKVVHECWLEQMMAGGWVAAYRLVPRDGRPLVAEVRVFPRDKTSPCQPGEWAAESQGFTAPVPPGGLTARMLKSIKLGTYLDDAMRIIRRMERKWGREAVHGDMRLLTRHGFTPATGQATSRSGRPPAHDDCFYAKLAQDYVRIIEHGNARSPVKELARERSFSPEHMGQLLHKAREHGMLTAIPKRGLAGGRLTAFAKSLLAAARKDSP
jgi:hypothetical protein